jgi:uncharacterized membrane protein YqjE
MSTTNTGHEPGPDASLGDLVAAVSRDVQELVTGQIELVKAELRENATAAAKTGGMFAGAAIAGFLAVVFLLVTFGYALIAAGLPAWAAFLIVTATLLVGAGVLAMIGRSQAKKIKGPERAVAAAKATGAAIGGSRTT